jgi:hypothetical protein
MRTSAGKLNAFALAAAIPTTLPTDASTVFQNMMSETVLA